MLSFLFMYFMVNLVFCQIPCNVPQNHILRLFALENGKETITDIKNQTLISENNQFDGDCFTIAATTPKYKNAVLDYMVMYKNRTNKCFFCYRYLSRSQYVIQYTHSDCQTTTVNLCESMSSEIFTTGFAYSRDTEVEFNCKSLIEGIYQFNYKFTDFTGVCDRQNSLIKACQMQGSPLRDNSVFKMVFSFCPGINPANSQGNIKYTPYEFTWRCYARWVERDDSIWGAINFDAYEEKFKYRCIKTRIDQQDKSKETWGMTADADCNTLHMDLAKAPVRLELKPAFDPDIQIGEMEPGCKLPINFTGNWFYPMEYNTEVIINSTHIYYRRKMEENRIEHIYFVCRQFQESRYLMATVTKGKCYLDFTCFHFLPRHQNIVRFRTSRPYRMDRNARDRNSEQYMTRIFREACHWNSFTLNYVDWVYEYYILDPPVPINCPIQGRYRFVQRGQKAEQYFTKIPGGMTPRPRVQVECEGKMEPDLISCYENPKQMSLDVERCMRLDFNGRPISEYDIADNRLTCVGYWMEDTKSFLITYDPEDPVTHNFRCWVYRRIDLNLYLMSRSQGTHCGKLQTSESRGPETEASLQLELTQNELEFDACPMSFDDGTDPYSNPAVFNVFSAAPSGPMAAMLTLLLSLSLAALRLLQ